MLFSRYPDHDWPRLWFALTQRKAFKKMQRRRRKVSSDGYSYQGFDQTRSIFIHIPKAAGVSVAKSLYGNLGGGHVPLADFRYVFSGKDFHSYFKFTFVRNPWDRLFSAYTFLQNGGFNEGDRQWAKQHLDGLDDFDDFVKRWVRPENIRKGMHFIPQLDYLLLPGKASLPLDFVGFFENIDDDFKLVSKALAMDVSLPHLNKGKHEGEPRYLSAYSEESRDIVAQVYQQDIEALGYSFDNSRLPEQLARRATGGQSTG